MFQRAEKMLHLGPTVHSRSPYVMTFDHFVTEEECQAFIDTSSSHFDRSLAGDVVSPVRTSRQSWCQPGIATECYHHPLTRRVGERVANLTGVPVSNAEFFQVLRYEPGQFYRVHHDQNSGPTSVMGVRLFTFFIYLKTPDGGGGTHFPRLNITIQPKRGSALLWPNVLDDDLSREDERTMHEALPPLAGLKYSSNLWLHQYDFRTPNMHGCDMRAGVDRASHVWPVDDVTLAASTNRSTGWPVILPRTGDADNAGSLGANVGEQDQEHPENDEL